MSVLSSKPFKNILLHLESNPISVSVLPRPYMIESLLSSPISILLSLPWTQDLLATFGLLTYSLFPSKDFWFFSLIQYKSLPLLFVLCSVGSFTFFLFHIKAYHLLEIFSGYSVLSGFLAPPFFSVISWKYHNCWVLVYLFNSAFSCLSSEVSWGQETMMILLYQQSLPQFLTHSRYSLYTS